MNSLFVGVAIILPLAPELDVSCLRSQCRLLCRGKLKSYRSDPFKKLVQTEVSPQGLDAYIVITKTKSNFGGGGRKVEGIGFITYGTLLSSHNQIHALYEIRVFDGKTFEVIEKRAAAPLENSGTMNLTGPSQLVDETFAPTIGDLSRNEKLHGAITDLIVHTLSSPLS